MHQIVSRSRLGVALAAVALLGWGSAQAQDGRNAEEPSADGRSSRRDPTLVETQAGVVKGVLKRNVVRFLGIPYAQPPIGELRWAKPQPVDPWTGVRKATSYGNFCAQLKTLGDFAAAGTDEDCLYLNVFAPKDRQSRPVMVWMHGGGHRVGMSNGHDGSALAREQNVVVVTINYRLGALGFLVHPALDGGGATTHYALRDQQLALRWVRDNIASFGGDPNNVTIFGESTGGVDVMFHMISPTARGLFHRAILQSGPSRYFNRLVPLAEAEERGEAFATAVGCPDQSAACLRNVPVSAILDAWLSPSLNVDPLLPIDDGHVLTMSVFDAIRSGEFNRVPFMDVTTHDEYRWFQAFEEISTGHVITAAEYSARLAAAFGENAPAVEAAYPLSDFDSPSGALAAARTDFVYPCQVRSFDVDASKYVRVYALEFNDPNSPGILPPTSFPLLASHTHEIQYIFPRWKGVFEGDVTPLTPQQEQLAKEMRRIWANFAEQGVLEPRKPPFTKDNQLVISLETPYIRIISDFRKDHKCDLWDSVRDWQPK
jgi:para-nitrobenzyl esterase